MTKEREVLQKVLDALRIPCNYWNKTQFIKVQEAIKAGEEALAQPEQVPFDGCVMVGYSKDDCAYFVYEETAPNEFCAIKGPFISCIDAKNAIRDPNAPLIEQPKEPEQEPVAWFYKDVDETGYEWKHLADSQADADMYLPHKLIPLYTTPPQRKPWVSLTDEDAKDIQTNMVYRNQSFRKVIEAIEAKLKEKNT